MGPNGMRLLRQRQPSERMVLRFRAPLLWVLGGPVSPVFQDQLVEGQRYHRSPQPRVLHFQLIETSGPPILARTKVTAHHSRQLRTVEKRAWDLWERWGLSKGL